MKIYRVSTILNAKGLTHDIIEWDAEEKKATYQMTRKDEWGYTTKRSFKKEKMHRIDTGVFYNSTGQVQFLAYCFKDEIEEWKEATKRSVIKYVSARKKELDELLNHIQIPINS